MQSLTHFCVELNSKLSAQDAENGISRLLVFKRSLRRVFPDPHFRRSYVHPHPQLLVRCYALSLGITENPQNN